MILFIWFRILELSWVGIQSSVSVDIFTLVAPIIMIVVIIVIMSIISFGDLAWKMASLESWVTAFVKRGFSLMLKCL